MSLPVGTICRIRGLMLAPQLNDKFCEILTPLEMVTVPEADGCIRTALRYGCEVITGPVDEANIGPINGYFKPENLEPMQADRRSMDLHLFGWTKE